MFAWSPRYVIPESGCCRACQTLPENLVGFGANPTKHPCPTHHPRNRRRNCNHEAQRARRGAGGKAKHEQGILGGFSMLNIHSMTLCMTAPDDTGPYLLCCSLTPSGSRLPRKVLPRPATAWAMLAQSATPSRPVPPYALTLNPKPYRRTAQTRGAAACPAIACSPGPQVRLDCCRPKP